MKVFRVEIFRKIVKIIKNNSLAANYHLFKIGFFFIFPRCVRGRLTWSVSEWMWRRWNVAAYEQKPCRVRPLAWLLFFFHFFMDLLCFFLFSSLVGPDPATLTTKSSPQWIFALNFSAKKNWCLGHSNVVVKERAQSIKLNVTIK